MKKKGRLTRLEKDAIRAAKYVSEMADAYVPPRRCKECADEYHNGLWTAWEWTVRPMLWDDARNGLRSSREPFELLFVALRWRRLRGEVTP